GEIVLSRAYSIPDPDTSQCYDLAPDQEPSAVPCAVASLLRENCAGCHHDTEGAGRLDLTRWIEVETRRFGFPDLDDAGDQTPVAETLQHMLDRISSRDPRIAMPRNRHMDSVDRQRLYTWLIKETEGKR